MANNFALLTYLHSDYSL